MDSLCWPIALNIQIINELERNAPAIPGYGHFGSG